MLGNSEMIGAPKVQCRAQQIEDIPDVHNSNPHIWANINRQITQDSDAVYTHIEGDRDSGNSLGISNNK